MSAGAGAGAVGFFKVDWVKGSVKFGGNADATLGLGAGAGGTVEVSIEQILKDPRMAGLCVKDGVTKFGKSLSDGAVAVGNAVASGFSAIFGWPRTNEQLVAALPRPSQPLYVPVGTIVARDTDTRAKARAPDPMNARKAQGAGMRR